ncbi:MAG: type II toxin-antitoxin system VapC family toxin [Phycisphaerae bacterium]|nr:type II toxin-antitoxin system VapC family toxin [Phycisphaerae bacterium]
MLLPDVNVLVYAFRTEHPQHAAFRAWLERLITGREAYGITDLVLSGFVRIVTHPRVFQNPDPLESALRFADQIRGQSHCVLITPGPRHWDIFRELCQHAQAKGNLVPDAYLAALAIESGSEWITSDRDYARFPGLRWRHPLAST